MALSAAVCAQKYLLQHVLIQIEYQATPATHEISAGVAIRNKVQRIQTELPIESNDSQDSNLRFQSYQSAHSSCLDYCVQLPESHRRS